MKLTITDKNLFEGVRAAFDNRDTFTLSGAGINANYVARELTYSPTGNFGVRPSISIEFEQVSIAEAPQLWNGEGLPPIGIECETLWSSTTGEYVSVLVVGHDGDRAVVRFTSSDRKGEYDSDRQHNEYGRPIFRALRTPEQVAAEQREKRS